MTALLAVTDLRVRYRIRDAVAVNALRGVNFEIKAGEVVGILGESGCGKTTIARSLAGRLSKNTDFIRGRVTFSGENSELTSANASSPRKGVTLISQEPALALNPVLRVGDQIVEVLRANNRWSKSKCRDEAERLLSCVRLNADPGLFNAFPHQLSGGQQQRIVIAQALACNPALLIADEPTASLDEDTSDDILRLLENVVSERNLSLLLITHSPGVLAQLSKRMLVMYAGRIVEEGLTSEVLSDPIHPYSKALLQSQNAGLRRTATRLGTRFLTIDGEAPNMESNFSGCSFASRCQSRMKHCTEKSPMASLLPTNRKVECFLYAD